MSGVPETRYARYGAAHIAYQVLGDGSDLLFVPLASMPIDLIWDEPALAGPLRRLSSFCRLILTDLLGAGSSDRLPADGQPPLQAWTDGLLAVLDAVESERASIFSMQGACLPVWLLAASHPDRVRSLVLWSPFARFLRADDHPVGYPEERLPKMVDRFAERVGTGALMEYLAPSWAGDDVKRRWWARCERLGGGPGYLPAMFENWMRTDLRPALSSIQAPSLLMRRTGDPDLRHDHFLELGNQVPRAQLMEFDGDGFLFAGDSDEVIDEVESFLTGERPVFLSNRVLSTVLFTDIVGSTQRAAQVGDDAWAATLASHNLVVEKHVASARGTVVKFTGDGVLATFNGPARAIECACALRNALQDIGLQVRTGLHTGEIEMGDGDIHGIAVHVAARIMGLAAAGEVLVSGVMPPLVLGSRIAFDDRGRHELKGVPDTWPVFAVRDPRDRN
jgi:class 3 adenylate cyclase